MANVLVETKELKKYFKVGSGMLHAVDGVNLKIEEGKTLGVVGESGCGKSTLGRIITRLLEPTDGDVLFRGESIMQYKRKQLDAVRAKMQMIFQDPYASLNPRMSVQELIAEPMLINKTYRTKSEVYERVSQLMDTVGLAQRLAAAYPHELDGGRRQRIGVARALTLTPDFIVCDEPVSALDVSIQAQILNLLMDLQQEMNLSYLFITHDLSVVKHISDDIAVMYMGNCVELAPAEELFKNPRHPYTFALLSAIPVPNLSVRNRQTSVIRGEVSDPVDPEPGCRFAPRCEFRTPQCTGADIPLRDDGTGHSVACVHPCAWKTSN